jgi:hypothetical protein
MASVRVFFKKSEVKKRLEKIAFKQQTLNLVEYAENEIKNIASELTGGSFNLDASTGNLLDSLCWGVYFNGNVRNMGYYRKQQASEDSYLHALSSNKISVNGHFLAQQFIANYKPTTHGWEIVFGILAPYQAYWEAGHYNVMLKQQVRFMALTQRYDVIKNELSPLCKVYLEINRPN